MEETDFVNASLLFFRIVHTILLYKDYPCDGRIISQVQNEIESLTNSVEQCMITLQPFLHFLTLNKSLIVNMNCENDWIKTRIDENDLFHLALKNILSQLSRFDREIINITLRNCASSLGFFNLDLAKNQK